MALEEKISSFPARPGVYLFKDAKGAVIYVGKAKNLHARIANYFGAGRDTRPQIAFLVKRARDLDYIVTDTEKEALLLENTLIKRHRPRYILHFKGDKPYLSIRIGLQHPSPGISVTRHPLKDGARYFGPYASGLTCREAIEQIIRHFKVRSCTDRNFANRVRPCILYDIGRCTAPCVGKVTPENYRQQVDEAMMFLAGQNRALMHLFRARMEEASEARQYEDAARFRNLIADIEAMIEKQKVVRHGAGDRDVAGIACDAHHAAACILHIRAGILIGKNIYHLGSTPTDEAELFESFLVEHYHSAEEMPPEIVLARDIEGRAALEELLTERRGTRVALRVPARGAALDLARLSSDNAREALKSHRATADDVWRILDRLRAKLKLPHAPDVIECLDISNLHGKDAYGSLVTFVMGEPDTSRYRLYRIRSLDTPDDYGMMREVIERRFRTPELNLHGLASVGISRMSRLRR